MTGSTWKKVPSCLLSNEQRGQKGERGTLAKTAENHGTFVFGKEKLGENVGKARAKRNKIKDINFGQTT